MQKQTCLVDGSIRSPNQVIPGKSCCITINSMFSSFEPTFQWELLDKRYNLLVPPIQYIQCIYNHWDPELVTDKEITCLK